MRENDLFKRFLEVIDSLEEEKVDYVLIGGFAVILYGLPRATQDIGILISQKKKILKNCKKLFTKFLITRMFMK